MVTLAQGAAEPTGGPGPMDQRTFDFIIVGAGSAGGGPPQRLPGNGRFSFLLLGGGGGPRSPAGDARGVECHQRDGVGARAAAGLRSLGTARQPRLELPGRATDLNRGWSYQDVLPI